MAAAAAAAATAVQALEQAVTGLLSGDRNPILDQEMGLVLHHLLIGDRVRIGFGLELLLPLLFSRPLTGRDVMKFFDITRTHVENFIIN